MCHFLDVSPLLKIAVMTFAAFYIHVHVGNSLISLDQSSATNSQQVGLMAESFAKQGWSIACGGGGSGTSHSPFSGRRSFSTHSSSAATTGWLLINN